MKELVAIFSALAGAGTDLDTQLLHPTFFPTGYASHPGLATLPEGHGLGAMMQLEHAPMVVRSTRGSVDDLVPLRFSIAIGAYATVLKQIAMQATIPLYQMSAEPPVSSSGLGDLRLAGVWSFARLDVLSFAATAELYLPTSTGGALIGERSIRGGPGAAIELSSDGFQALAGASLMLRELADTGHELERGTELVVTAAIAWESAVRYFAEIQSRTALSDSRSSDPLDLRFGLRLRAGPQSQVAFTIVAGSALNSGYGAADARVMIGMTVPFSVLFSGDEEEQEVTASRSATREDELPHEPRPEPRPEPPPPAPAPIDPRGRLLCPQLGAAVTFDRGSDRLSAEAIAALDQIAAGLRETSKIALVVVEGHASADGSTPRNWVLSEARARAVFRHLVEAGVSPFRLAIRGLGEVVPAGARAEEEVRDEDRRVELCVGRALDLLDEIPDWDAGAPPVPWAP